MAGKLSPNELCPVRPGDHKSGEGPFADQEDYQDPAYRNAWESFNPDEDVEEEEQTSGEGDAHERDDIQEEGAGRGRAKKQSHHDAQSTECAGMGRTHGESLAMSKLVRALCPRESEGKST